MIARSWLRYALTNFTLEAATLTVRKPTPDSEALIMLQGILEAFITHRAGLADALSLAGRSSLFGKECFRVRLGAQRLVLPLLLNSAKEFIQRQRCRSSATEIGVISHVVHAVFLSPLVVSATGCAYNAPGGPCSDFKCGGALPSTDGDVDGESLLPPRFLTHL